MPNNTYVTDQKNKIPVDLARKIFTDYHKSGLISAKAAEVQSKNLHYFLGRGRTVVVTNVVDRIRIRNPDPNPSFTHIGHFFTSFDLTFFKFTLFFYLSRQRHRLKIFNILDCKLKFFGKSTFLNLAEHLVELDLEARK